MKDVESFMEVRTASEDNSVEDEVISVLEDITEELEEDMTLELVSIWVDVVEDKLVSGPEEDDELDINEESLRT